ncbi:MAG: ectonucleotide pyrophosphatase/phosphodiesterase, partial [Acidobacteriota bacterium]
MKNYFSLIAVLILALSSFVVAQTGARNDFKPTVILISADGFRPDYLDRYPAPTLNRLASAGIRAEWMETSFPAKTFPNHYSVATGLYPANHGIVDNNVWDFGTVFSMGKREEVENPRWWLGEPIWVTAQKQGQIAASYFFVGSEAPISGVRPKYWRSYNGGVPPQLRVDTVLGWLDLPVNERPTLITMYFSDTDDAGHEFGPDSAEAKYAVTNVDGYIARLEAGL